MLQCENGGIYIGIALDVDARYLAHKSGRGAMYTRLNAPMQVIARVQCANRRAAAKLEYYIKRLPRHEKLRWAFALGATFE